MNKKRAILIVSLAGCVLAVVIVCLLLSQRIRVGIIVSTDTPMGYEVNLAAKFYRDRFPTIDGRPVEYIILNPKLDDAEIEAAYKKLIELKVSFIAGGMISREGLILRALAEKYSTPTFGITTSSELLAGKKDSFYMMLENTVLEGKVAAEYLMKQGYKKLLIFTSVKNKAFALPLAESIRKQFTGDAAIIPYENTKATWEQADTFGADCVYLALSANQMAEVIANLEESQPRIPIVLSSWDFEILTKTYYNPSMEGIRVVTIYSIHKTRFQDLLTEFALKYKVMPGFAVNYFFAVMELFRDTVRKVGSDPAALNMELSRPGLHSDYFGNIYLDEFGDSIPEFNFIYEITNGELKLIDKIRIDDFPSDVKKRSNMDIGQKRNER